MRRLAIHAGFPKTGSSTIQFAIGMSLSALRDSNYYILGKQIDIDLEGRHPGLPIWFLEDVAKSLPIGQTLVPKLVAAADPLPPDATLILSSENLSQQEMPRLFEGADDVFDVSVVLYIRPQSEWIPSAWKQWGLKKGLSLSTFVRHCIKNSRPQNLLSIQGWEQKLPKAKIVVRPFFRETMYEANPAQDFFHLIGFKNYDPAICNRAINPSLDYSILHLMMRNAHVLFDGIYDNRVEERLSELLPPAALATNAPMLSDPVRRAVEDQFAEETKEILKNYCNIEKYDEFYQQYFVKPDNGAISYMEMEEMDILARGFRIIADVIGTDRATATLGVLMKGVLSS